MGLTTNFALNSARWQIRTNEGAELLYSKHLLHHIKQYRKIKRHLLRYRVKEKKGEEISVIKRIIKKHRNRPVLLKKLLIREIEIFTYYLEAFYELIGKIELDADQVQLNQNAAIIRDETEMTSIINKVAGSPTTVGLFDDFANLEKDAEQLLRQEAKKARTEYLEMQKMLLRASARAKKALSWTLRAILPFRSIHGITHKIVRLARHVKNRDILMLHAHIQEIQQAIAGNKISKVTGSQLRAILIDYKQLRIHYHKIEADFLLIMVKLFEDFDVIVNQCIVPFFAEVRNIEGAEKIQKINTNLKNKYIGLKKELGKSEFEIKKVYEMLIQFVQTCRTQSTKLRGLHQQMLQQLRAKMSYVPPS